MAIIWDAPLTTAVARELETRLAGHRLRGHVFDWERREISLFFRRETLRWALHPQAGWLRLDPAATPPETLRPLSAELLRVEASPDERIIRFLFRKRRGTTRNIQIIVELMTNQWNALLTEGPEEWIRHILWTRRGKDRPLSVGAPYRPPTPSGRKGIHGTLPQDEWNKLPENADEGEEEEGRILDWLAYSSPLNVRALREKGYAFWLRLRDLEPYQPCLLETRKGRQPYPLVIPGLEHEEFPSLLAAFAAVSDEESGEESRHRHLLERTERALHRALGRLRGLEREMAEVADPNQVREKANLLLARLGEIRKGAAEVVLEGFRGEKVTLSLDPTLSPHENAEALYREASRQERALKRLPHLLSEARDRAGALGRLREGLLAGTISPEEVDGHLPPARERRWGSNRREEARLPFKRFRSSGGLEIRVGRGPADNDSLTFHHSSPGDVWLHARQAGGAHVVLRWTEDHAPPKKDLTEAAVLAALHSVSRHAGVVPVDWTRRKYVRKPRKSAPGTVVLERSETLFVKPDPDLPQRLAWEE